VAALGYEGDLNTVSPNMARMYAKEDPVERAGCTIDSFNRADHLE